MGTLTASQMGAELLFKIPSEYLTFGRRSETQGAEKIYHGERPPGGKVVYISGGSSGFASANEHALSEELTKRMGVPVRVYVIAYSSQSVTDSYSLQASIPKADDTEQVYILMTYGGHRAISEPHAAIRSTFKRTRTLVRPEALRKLINDENLLEEPSFYRGLNTVTDHKKYMAEMDKEFTSSVGSHWLKNFFHDKMKKLSRNVKNKKSYFVEQDVFRKNDYAQSRLDSVYKSFQKPKIRKRREQAHKKYADILLRNISNLTPEEAERRQNFARYMFKKSKETSDRKNFKFGALELPVYNDLLTQPVILEQRKNFNRKMQSLSIEHDFPVFYLEDAIEELDVFEYWYDTGHMSPIGRHKFQKYYVDALVKFLNGDRGGVYGAAEVGKATDIVTVVE